MKYKFVSYLLHFNFTTSIISLSELIRHLTAFSSKIECEKSAVSINHSVMNAIDILRVSLPENIAIKTRLKEEGRQ